MRTLIFLLICVIFISCNSTQNKRTLVVNENAKVELIILGTVQDAGSPHIACVKSCCKNLFTTPDPSRKVVSLGLIDNENKQSYLFEATPDISTQLKMLKRSARFESKDVPNGIFLTHAHIGHYTGLMYFGKEAMGAKNVNIYSMPKMRNFLKANGPWSQLVNDSNILLHAILDTVNIKLTNHINVVPFLVPHRDEFSETVGYKIVGPNKSALFIPDINKWSIWSKSIVDEINKVDYAFIDATFYDGKELPNRNISEIPHPFAIESMELFYDCSETDKKKIYFIHLNHTNPLLDSTSAAYKTVLERGFNVAKYGLKLSL